MPTTSGYEPWSIGRTLPDAASGETVPDTKIADLPVFERNPPVRLPHAVGTAAAVVSTLAVLLTPGAAHAAPGDTIALPVRDALTALTIRNEDRTGYERTKFRHWIDADRDGCSTRSEVLIEEAVIAPEQGPNCALTGGSWYSPYDDAYFPQARALDVDHLVPLAEARDSGASAWTAAERQAYANDLDDARALIAVSAASNRSKARPTRTPPPGSPRPPAAAAPTQPTGSPSRPVGTSPSTPPNRRLSPRSSTPAPMCPSRSPSPADHADTPERVPNPLFGTLSGA